jgi:hypothetical protein
LTPSALETSGTRVGLESADALGFLMAEAAAEEAEAEADDVSSLEEFVSWLLLAVFSFEELLESVFLSLLSRRGSLGADMEMVSTCWLLRLLLR